MTSIATQPEVFDEARRRKAKKATAVGAFGTFIEYYDFSVYGYVAATLAVVFFPNDDPVIGLLNTFLVFGLAFLVRPLGAIFFGRLGDRSGRRTSLIASILLMSVAAALTGFLPGYAQIGIAAPILLVLLRMLQGFSTGGEIGGAASYIREWAAPEPPPVLHLVRSRRRPARQGRRSRDRRAGGRLHARRGHGGLGLADPVPARCSAGPAVPGPAARSGRQPRVHRRPEARRDHQEPVQNPAGRPPRPAGQGDGHLHRAKRRHLHRHRVHRHLPEHHARLLQGPGLHHRAAGGAVRLGVHPDGRDPRLAHRRQENLGGLLHRLRAS